MGIPEEASAPRISRRASLVLIGAAVVMHAWPAGRRLLAGPPEQPAFAFSLPQPPAPDESAFKSEEFVSPERDPQAGGTKVHVGSICELPDGRLASAWYAGSAEGAWNTQVRFATRGAARGSAWTEPRVLVGRDSAARELGRFVLKVGNPILFTDREGRLWLFYVSSAISGWSTSSLNVKTSTDGGATWTRSRRLTLSPFGNISELVKNKPVMLAGGGFVLPVYHEFIGLFPEMLRVRGYPGGQMSWRKTRVAGWRSFFQPSLVPLGPRSAVAFFRCSAPQSAVGIAATSDAGLTWTKPRFTELPNPNSAVDALLLSDGRILLAFNDSRSGRANLRLAVLEYDRPTGGLTATRAATLEEDAGKRFSYPYMIRTRDGLIHIVYTWQRRRIKHVAFNEAWLRERLTERRSPEERSREERR